jgi:hypothetical protein
MRLSSYAKIYAMGHPRIADLFNGPVVVEEKIDGSQFSFASIGGELCCRSKGAIIDTEHPDHMFRAAVSTAKDLHSSLVPGFIYRGEYLRKPHHNGLAYERIPRGHVMIWDVQTGEQSFAPPAERQVIAEGIGLEVAPVLAEGTISLEQLDVLLKRESVLGGQPIEGVVVKNYNAFGDDGKILAGKHVREEYKEVQRREWRKTHPTKGDVVDKIIASLTTSARWEKAVYRMRDAGKLTSTPRDIGALIKEVQSDIEAECKEEIQQRLYEQARKKILRGAVRGLPEWYKRRLLESQFSEEVVRPGEVER